MYFGESNVWSTTQYIDDLNRIEALKKRIRPLWIENRRYQGKILRHTKPSSYDNQHF